MANAWDGCERYKKAPGLERRFGVWEARVSPIIFGQNWFLFMRRDGRFVSRYSSSVPLESIQMMKCKTADDGNEGDSTAQLHGMDDFGPVNRTRRG